VTILKPKRHKYSKLFKDLYVFLEFLYNEIIIKEDVVHVFLKRKRKRVKCPQCKKKSRFYGESYKRTVRDLDLGNKLCFITFFEVKLFCACGFRGYESIEFARRYSHCTIRFENYVYKLCEKMTISDVSRVVGLNWKTVKNIDKYYIQLGCRSTARL